MPGCEHQAWPRCCGASSPYAACGAAESVHCVAAKKPTGTLNSKVETAKPCSRAAAHMLRIRQGPALMRAQICGAIDTAANIALRTICQDRDKAHARRVARLRMLDRR